MRKHKGLPLFTAVGNSITSGQPEQIILVLSVLNLIPTSLLQQELLKFLTEMGAHFSPCGRYLVACVACLLPHTESDPGTRSSMQLDAAWAATSPTRHPFSTHQVIYELRIYSLEEETFGNVLASRAIRAAHCLTSIQFSSTSEHILLAYGRRHESLLRSIVIDREMTIPIYTILEVYRVSDMELVGVLPSAEDEEGKLRILQYDGPQDGSPTTANSSVEENMLVVFVSGLSQIEESFREGSSTIDQVLISSFVTLENFYI
ncbi:hypothetical protein ACMD2_24709 [Ananas comosus]|uniref:Uncharacterized protein n=1 Tax=Ananas comosus TaxID=4615 RepID=A0A199V2K9_ANACO|nr:hypothetical protein ACMD2_24709 [Ananas comosus]